MKADIRSSICQICEKLENKYRCPSCAILYCSLACFKDHKSSQCQERQHAFVIDTEPSAAVEEENEQLPSYLNEIEPKYRIPVETLQKLGESEELKGLLANRHLRDFLTLLNSKNYPQGLIRNAMKEPLFLEFADACLKDIHPEDYKRELADEEVVEKLQDAMECSK